MFPRLAVIATLALPFLAAVTPVASACADGQQQSQCANVVLVRILVPLHHAMLRAHYLHSVHRSDCSRAVVAG